MGFRLLIRSVMVNAGSKLDRGEGGWGGRGDRRDEFDWYKSVGVMKA